MLHSIFSLKGFNYKHLLRAPRSSFIQKYISSCLASAILNWMRASGRKLWHKYISWGGGDRGGDIHLTRLSSRGWSCAKYWNNKHSGESFKRLSANGVRVRGVLLAKGYIWAKRPHDNSNYNNNVFSVSMPRRTTDFKVVYYLFRVRRWK